jgi:hypothetical protein
MDPENAVPANAVPANAVPQNREVHDRVIEGLFSAPVYVLMGCMYFPPAVVLGIPLALVLTIAAVVVSMPYIALVYASGRQLRLSMPDNEEFGCHRSWNA